MKEAHLNSDRSELFNFQEQFSQVPQQFQAGDRSVEERLKVIVENMAEALIEMDLSWRVTSVNNKVEQLLGINRDQLLGKLLWNVLFVNSTTHFSQYCHQAIAEKLPVEFEEFYPALNRWLTVRLFPTPTGILAYFLDITGRKQLETTLRKEQDFLNVLLDNVQAGIVACDADGQLKLFNQAARLFHGLPEQPLLPEEWAEHYDLYLPDGKTPMNTNDIPLFQALQGQQVDDVEMMIVPQEGVPRILSTNGQAIVNFNGEKQGAVVVMHDITHRKQIENALRDSEARLSSIFQTIPDGIVIINSAGQIIAANKAAEQIFRLTHSGITERVYNDSSWSITTVDGNPFPDDELPFVRVMRTGKPIYGVEHAIAHADGTTSILSINASPLCNAEGEIVSVITAFSDITERKQAEEKRVELVREQVARAAAEAAQQQSAFLAEVSAVLATSLEYEQTLQSVADLAVPYFADWCSVDLLNDDRTISRVAVAHCDPQKVKLGWEVTQRYPRHLDDGYGVSQVMQTGHSEIAMEITDEQLAAAVRDPEYLRILRGLSLKSCIIAPLKARERVFGSISFIFTESNRRYKVTDLTLAEDLARRAAIAIDNARLYQQAQQARQAAEHAANRTARLQTVTAALSEPLTPVQVVDVIMEQSMAVLEAASGMVVLVSEDRTELEIVKVVGYENYSLESWQRFSINTAVPLAEAVRTGEPVWMETVAQRVTRYPHLAEAYSRYDNSAWMSLPLVIEGRSVGGMSLTFTEYKHLTEDDREFILAISRQCAQAISRAQLYEAERKARAEAEQANRVKDEFLAVLSHELRSPLNPILGWTKLLRTQKLPPTQVNQALETIERNAKLQAQLVEDLLDISRMLRGKLSLNTAPVNLIAVIEEAIETVQLAAATKSIHIQTVFQPGKKKVLGDANRLQQVIWNLLSNAIKFTPEGGRVEVKLEQTDNRVQIQVIDNGKGIKADFLPHVFEYFRQADSSTTRRFGGLGLGLAIVRQIVELHGGTVQAQSLGEDLGATFTVLLPAMSIEPESSTATQPSTQPTDLTDIRVLVVDDEADMGSLAQFILAQHGAKVTVASSAAEALTILTQFIPNVLLCDIGMPEMDGYMLMRQVRGLSPEQGGTIPAIAFTAYASEYDRRQAIAAGFQLHLSKPVEPEALVEAIFQVIHPSPESREPILPHDHELQ
ncbi:PAS domain S-box protein [Nostoc sp. 106C]|uniref:PAS domain S-box protein n=1 Tax=Nostoc sp. 106C TaxID=1932667 RepID=UPI000A3CCB54|nr:PAS domain S-box protein [Nostoc sp. 106C]OUL32169.1 histidine kinase [Nostoc sp. 106C]